MINQILILTDFSVASRNALDVGFSFGDIHQSEVSVLYIFPSRASSTDSNKLDRGVSTQVREIEKNMQKLNHELIKERSISVKSLVVAGNIKKELSKFIDRNSFDLIVAGLNSANNVSELGTHSKLLLEKAKCPVLIVPNQFSYD